MKKLLGIVVLGLLLSTSAYGKLSKDNQVAIYHECFEKDLFKKDTIEEAKPLCYCFMKYHYDKLTNEEFEDNFTGAFPSQEKIESFLQGVRHCKLLLEKKLEIEIEHKWTKVGKTPSGDRDAYVDLVNLKKDGDHMYYWDLTDGKKSYSGDRGHSIYWKVNCITLASSMVTQIFYKDSMASGEKEVIPIQKNQKGWFLPEPGTFGDKAARMVCEKKSSM